MQHAHSSHAKLRDVFGAREPTALDAGLRAMAGWVREQGARSAPAFEAIEVRKNLPAVWARA